MTQIAQQVNDMYRSVHREIRYLTREQVIKPPFLNKKENRKKMNCHDYKTWMGNITAGPFSIKKNPAG